MVVAAAQGKSRLPAQEKRLEARTFLGRLRTMPVQLRLLYSKPGCETNNLATNRCDLTTAGVKVAWFLVTFPGFTFKLRNTVQ
jgi:hypothetical protein